MSRRKSRRERGERPEKPRNPAETGQPSGTARPHKPAGPHQQGGGLWLYGSHAVLAALANPKRRLQRLILAPEAADRLGPQIAEIFNDRQDGHPGGAGGMGPPEIVERRELERRLPEGAVHQGLALLTEPLPTLDLEDLLDLPAPAGGGRRVIVALDQVTDPHNVGAILRSAAAFGALALISPERHSAPESGSLAKAASGALERVPYVGITNLARSLEQLKQAGFWCLGLDAGGERLLAEADPGPDCVLVLGAEGKGLRRLTRERCDLLTRLPTASDFGHLNVSTAAAVALYELLGRRG